MVTKIWCVATLQPCVIQYGQLFSARILSFQADYDEVSKGVDSVTEEFKKALSELAPASRYVLMGIELLLNNGSKILFDDDELGWIIRSNDFLITHHDILVGLIPDNWKQ